MPIVVFVFKKAKSQAHSCSFWFCTLEVDLRQHQGTTVTHLSTKYVVCHVLGMFTQSMVTFLLLFQFC